MTGDRGHHRHRHGHHHDRGVRGALRYLRLLPRMWRSEVNDALVAELAPRQGERVLDLGAGAGAATVPAAYAGAAVLAVDPTPFMRGVLRLRRFFHPHGRAIEILDGAAEALPAGDASVDALVTVNTLHHWTAPAAAARELARVLRPGARALLLDEDFDRPEHPEHARWAARHGGHRPTFDEVDPEALARTLAEAGFAQAHGARTTLAGRPVKIVRATR